MVFLFGLSPDRGFNVETVEYRNLRLTVWDIGGADPWIWGIFVDAFGPLDHQSVSKTYRNKRFLRLKKYVLLGGQKTFMFHSFGGAWWFLKTHCECYCVNLGLVSFLTVLPKESNVWGTQLEGKKKLDL